jgi:phosphoesterase RecJ-like protein
MLNQESISIADDIWKAILSAKKILLHCHPSPDGDSVGSVLSMYHALTAQSKEVTVIWGDSGATEHFSFLPGYEKIIPKNFFEVDLNEYDVFIAEDSGGLEMISKKGPVIFPDHLKVIVIDHHQTNTKYGSINLVINTSPATAQINYELFTLWNIPITKEIARCLILGLFTDTGGFKYRGVSSRTFEIMSHLVTIEPDFSKIISELENNNEFERVAFMGLALHSIHMFCNKKLAVSIVTHDDLIKNNIPEVATHKQGVANYLKSIRGVEVGVQCTEIDPGLVKMSFRSRDGKKHDVSKLAEILGGGGHVSASATLMKMSLVDAKEKLLKTVVELYPDFC